VSVFLSGDLLERVCVHLLHLGRVSTYFWGKYKLLILQNKHAKSALVR